MRVPRMMRGQQRRIALILLSMTAGSGQAQNPVDGYAPAVNGDVRAIVAQPDGHSMIGGFFSTAAGQSCSNLCRLTVDGQIAPGFDVTGANDSVSALQLQPDGKVLVGGIFTSLLGQPRSRLARLNADGSLDANFTPGIFDGNVQAIALQADGKILIGGSFNGVGGFGRPKLARLFADGRVDPGFSVIGNGVVNAIVELADGRVLVGGDFSNFGGPGGNNLVRLRADGTLNSGADLAANGPVLALAREANGRIVVGGGFTQIGSQSRSRLARLLSDGGVAFTALPAANNLVRSLLVLDDGDVVIGGNFSAIGNVDRLGMARLLRGGDVLSSYTPNIGGGWVAALAAQPDGHLLLGGGFVAVNNEERRALARLHPGGDLDTNFDVDATTDTFISSVATRADDQVLVGGNHLSIDDRNNRTGVARLRSNGSLDSDFEPLPGIETNSIRFASALRGNQVLAGGRSGTVAPVLLRLANDGSGGDLGGPLGGTIVRVAFAEDDGRILLAGNFDRIAGVERNDIARLLTDGSVDPAFAPSITGGVSGVLSAASDSDGRLLIGGGFTAVNGVSRANLARLFPDGTLDSAFVPLVNGSVSSVLRQPDGAVIIAGGFTTVGGTVQLRLARLREDGSHDASFAPHFDGGVEGVTLQADGKLIVTGAFATVDGIAQPRIARLHANGRLDADFEPVILGSLGDRIRAATLQRDGKVLIAGTLQSVNGMPRSQMARLATGAPALESLGAQGTSLIWLRSGAAAELALPPMVEISPDGSSYSGRFPMRRIAGGWRLDRLPIDVGEQVYLRISGESVGGSGAASRSRTERVLRHVLTDHIFRHGFD